MTSPLLDIGAFRLRRPCGRGPRRLRRKGPPDRRRAGAAATQITHNLTTGRGQRPLSEERKSPVWEPLRLSGRQETGSYLLRKAPPLPLRGFLTAAVLPVQRLRRQREADSKSYQPR